MLGAFMNIIERLTNPEASEVDLAAGTFTVLKACVLVLMHRQFIGCDLDVTCITTSKKELVHRFIKQVLHPDSDVILSSTEYGNAARTIRKSFLFHQACHCLNRRKVPNGLSPTQTVPRHAFSYMRIDFAGFTMVSSVDNMVFGLVATKMG